MMRSGTPFSSRSTISAPRGSRPGSLSRLTSRTTPSRARIRLPCQPWLRGLSGVCTDTRLAALLQRAQVEQALPVAGPLVGLLQRDHVGVDLGDDPGRPLRVEPAVGADAFVDVVGGDRRAALLDAGILVARRFLANGGQQRFGEGRRPMRHSQNLGRTGGTAIGRRTKRTSRKIKISNALGHLGPTTVASGNGSGRSRAFESRAQCRHQNKPAAGFSGLHRPRDGCGSGPSSPGCFRSTRLRRRAC